MQTMSQVVQNNHRQLPITRHDKSCRMLSEFLDDLKNFDYATNNSNSSKYQAYEEMTLATIHAIVEHIETMYRIVHSIENLENNTFHIIVKSPKTSYEYDYQINCGFLGDITINNPNGVRIISFHVAKFFNSKNDRRKIYRALRQDIKKMVLR